MDYQPLNGNEIRLIYFTQTKETLTSPENATAENPEGVIRLNMRTVSLDDYTPESLEWMKSKGTTVYRSPDYINQQGVVLDLNDPQEQGDGLTAVQRFERSFGELCARPDFGRWTWGDYDTLSYTWGDAGSTRCIEINGRDIHITENLYDFLRSRIVNLRDVELVCRERNGFWIDALCINQNDVEERNVQVKRMGEIYSKATGADVWLGNANESGDKLLESLKNFVTPFIATRVPTAQQNIHYLAEFLNNPAFWNRDTRNALQKLLSAPYWSRLWIIQELALSLDSVNLRYGNSQITWVVLYIAIHLLSCAWGQVIASITEDTETGNFGENFDQWGLNCGRILRLGGFRQAFMAEDKVYGILSLIDPSLAARITPDYKLETSEVYLDFARAVIEHGGNLDIITQSSLSNTGRVLPSWAPDWMEECTVNAMSEEIPFQASKDLKQNIRFKDNKLIVKGFIIDKLDGLGAKWPPNVVDDAVEEEAFEVFQPSQDLNTYQDEAGLREALWRTMVMNRNSDVGVAPDCYAGLLDIPWHIDMVDADGKLYIYHMIYNGWRVANEKLRIGGREFKEHFSVGKNLASVLDSMRDGSEPFLRTHNACQGRRLIITSKGFIGMARNEVQHGDVIAILLGCSVPVVLRPDADGGSFTLFGDIYVHGVMEGEAMEWVEKGLSKFEEIVIS